MIENNNTKNVLNSLSFLGWSSFFQLNLDKINNDNAFPARVTGVYKNRFLVTDGNKEILVTTAGRLNHKKNALFPVTGDWVLVVDKLIITVLPRKNTLSRGAAGTRGKQEIQSHKEQVIAANLDTIFIVCGTDRDFNLRRIERYLTLVYNCGLNPVIILTKADLHKTPKTFVEQVEDIAFGVPVYLISANESHELMSLEKYISDGQTIAMIGSSGAGKSTLVNRLYGKIVQPTSAISEKMGKGTHTTTHRSLILMPQGGMVIDNPGIREIGFWDDKDGLNSVFPEIETLARSCRFHDCSHTHEPGCQVCYGVTTGTIKQNRLDSYHKMKRELDYLNDRQHKSADRLEKERWKKVALKIKAIKKKENHQHIKNV